jgi:hypothetical protein
MVFSCFGLISWLCLPEGHNWEPLTLIFTAKSESPEGFPVILETLPDFILILLIDQEKFCSARSVTLPSSRMSREEVPIRIR